MKRVFTHLSWILMLCVLPARAERIVDMDCTLGPVVSDRSTIALVDKRSNQLQFFKSADDSKPFAAADIGPKAKSLAFKPFKDKGYFAVACEGDGAIYVLEDKTGALFVKVPIKGSPSLELAADPRSDSPYIYYFRPGSKDRIGRISLEAKADEGWLKDRSGISASLSFHVVPDGRTLIARPSDGSSSSLYRLELLTSSGGDPEIVERSLIPANGSHAYVDLRGRFAVGTGSAYTISAPHRRLANLSGPAVGGLAKRPVIFLWTGRFIESVSTNDFRSLGFIDPAPYAGLKVDSQDPKRDLFKLPPNTRNGSAHMQIDVDEAGGRLVCRLRDTLFEIPLKNLPLPDEPFISIVCDADTRLAPNEDWRGKLIFDPAVKVELRNAPEGMTLKDGELYWRPGYGDVGDHNIELSLTREKTTLVQEIPVVVRHSFAQLPFHPNLVRLSASGEKTLCLRLAPRTSIARRGSNENTELAVVDNKTLRITATLQTTEPILDAAIDEERAYLVIDGAGAMKVLSLSDLGKAQDVFTPRRAGSVAVVGKCVGLAGYNNTIQWFHRESLRPASLDDAKLGNPSQLQRAVAVGDRLQWGGLEYDAKTFRPIGLTDTLGIMSVGGYDEPYRPRGPIRENRIAHYRFGATVIQNAIDRIGTESISTGSKTNLISEVLDDTPAFASLEFTHAHVRGDEYRPGNLPRLSAILCLRDLVGARELNKIVVEDEPLSQLVESGRLVEGAENNCTIGAAADTLIVTVRNRLYRFTSAALLPKPPPLPLLLMKKGKILALRGEPGTFEWELSGGKAPYRYWLLSEIPGVSLVPNKPAVRLDPRAFGAGAARDLLKLLPSGSTPIADTFTEYAQRERARLKALFGIELQHFPAIAKVVVRVTDADNQSFTATELIVVDVPEQVFEQQLAEREAFQNQLKAGQAVVDSMRRPSTIVNSGGDPESTAKLLQRVRELELENAKLQGQVDLLMELLFKKNQPTESSNE